MSPPALPPHAVPVSSPLGRHAPASTGGLCRGGPRAGAVGAHGPAAERVGPPPPPPAARGHGAAAHPPRGPCRAADGHDSGAHASGLRGSGLPPTPPFPLLPRGVSSRGPRARARDGGGRGPVPPSSVVASGLCGLRAQRLAADRARWSSEARGCCGARGRPSLLCFWAASALCNAVCLSPCLASRLDHGPRLFFYDMPSLSANSCLSINGNPSLVIMDG